MAHEHLRPAEAKRPSCNLWGVVESVLRRGFTRSSVEGGVRRLRAQVEAAGHGLTTRCVISPRLTSHTMTMLSLEAEASSSPL